jgi:endo-1,4-beta-xylanase
LAALSNINGGKNMKRTAFLAALILAEAVLHAQADVILKSDFEDGKTGGWSGRGSAVISASAEAAHAGKYGLSTSGRTQSWNGPSVDLTGKVLFSGTYGFSAWVKIKEGQPDADIIMTVQREKGGTQNWDRVTALNAKTGSWVNVAGNYEPTSEFDKISMYIESSNATLEYYIDDVAVTVVKEPLKAEAAQPTGMTVPSLAEAYKNNFIVGAAVELNQLSGPEAGLLVKHFSGLTAENIMKPQYMAPAEGVFNFDSADTLADFAVKNNKALRGHTLLWHTQNAKWMFYDAKGNKVSKTVLLQRLEKYITAVVGRYKGKVYAWDVVNEVVDGAGLRNSEWLEIAGEEYIEKAFLYARMADPKAKLFINEYDTTDPVKGDTLYKLVKKLRDKNIPVDGVGMQFHISIDYPGVQSISDSLKKFSGLGVEIHITELDMSLNADPNVKTGDASRELLIRQGHRYRQIFEVFKSFKAVTNVTFWGFHDGHTWLTYVPVAKADWPLLFDRSYNPKYAYWGLVDPSRLPADVVLTGKGNTFSATAPKGTPVIDGIEDEIWKTAPEMKINIYVEGKGAYGVGKALWDEKNLYVFVKVTDGNLSKINRNAYEQDSIEIFVDEKNNKSTEYLEDDAQYRISFENDFSSRGYPARIQSVPVVTKTGYWIEVKIPLQTIQGVAGTAIGFDLQINDDPGTGARSSYSKWNDPTNESYRNTSGFGTLIFGN